MRSLRDFNEDYRRRTNLPLRIVDDFPAYWVFGGGLEFGISKTVIIGSGLRYYSTGSRLDYSDYSGSARLDITLKAYSPNINLQIRLNSDPSWHLLAAFSGSFTITKSNFYRNITIGNYSEGEMILSKSRNIGVTPQLILRKVVKLIIFQGSLGYELQAHKELTSSSGLFFQTSNGKNVSAEWDGLRVRLGIGVKLNGDKFIQSR